MALHGLPGNSMADPNSNTKLAASGCKLRPMLRIRLLDRYVFREILGPVLLGLLVFTFMLLIDTIFDLAEIIIKRDVPALLVGRLLVLSLPYIVVLTIPMAFLFGILLSIGRLSADSELVAIRASGVSLFSLYRPISVLALILAAINCFLMVAVLPWGNTAQQDLQLEIFMRSVNKEVEPGVFYEELEDKILYVADEVDGRWQGVFLTDSILSPHHVVTVAQYGSVRVEGTGNHVALRLQGAAEHEMDIGEPLDSATRQHSALELFLEDDAVKNQRQYRAAKDVRTLDLAGLRDRYNDPEQSETNRRLALVELHKKFAIPAACLVFGLFGVPLGFNNQRGNRSSGFAISLVIILVYHVLLSNGETAAAQGKVPVWLAMWGANILFVVVGLFLLWRRNRDKSLLLGRFDRWFRERLWGRLRVFARLRQRRQYIRRSRRRDRQLARMAYDGQREEGTGDSGGPGAEDLTEGESDPGGRRLLLRLERPRLRFPNIFDRYLLTLFTRIFCLVVLSGVTLYVVANFADTVDEVLENDISSAVVVDYYKFMSFRIFNQLAPIVVLLTTLISFGVLSKSNEVTAAKAVGMSLYRLAAPVVVAAALLVGLNALLESSVLPYSNAKTEELKAVIRGEDARSRRTFRRANEQWLYGEGGYIYHYRSFDEERLILQNLHIFRFAYAPFRLTGRLYAQEAAYRDGAWVVAEAWAKSFENNQLQSTQVFDKQTKIDLPEEPQFFSTEIKSPLQMNRQELSAYVTTLKSSGQEIPELEVQLHSKLSGPASSLVMAFVALPFAFRMGRRGALYGIGVAIAIGMAFYATNALFSTLGEAGALPAMLAVWAPNVLFTSFSLYLFLGVRS